MYLDIGQLKAFYRGTMLGRAAQRVLRERVADLWPMLHGMTVVGFGFATPVLGPLIASNRRVIALMPGQQGAMQWPRGPVNRTVLCEETDWPLPTGFVDRLIVMHGLENAENPPALLDEIWRVLAPGGKALFIVPNRLGMWSRRDITPFGSGRPYSLGQLESQLIRHRFEPGKHRAALFVPPSQRKFWLRLLPTGERLGQKISSHTAGGVLMVEASKKVFAPTKKGLPEAVRRPLEVFEGIARPRPKPASGRMPQLKIDETESQF